MLTSDMTIRSAKLYTLSDLHLPVGDGCISVNLISRYTGVLQAIRTDKDQTVESKFSPFDRYIQVLDGRLTVKIEGKEIEINAGQFLIVPGHSRYTVRSAMPSLFLSLIVKSGYEENI